MDIARAERIAKEKMLEHGLEHWEFGFDDSMRRRGCCHWSEKRITLSLGLTKIRTEDAVVNTILHEIAHALTPGTNHSKAWYDKAISIGCDGTRCSPDDVTIQAPFVGICPGCGRTITRHRRVKASCRKCSGGVFNRKYLFKWSRAS